MPHGARDRSAKSSVHSGGARLEIISVLREPPYPRLHRHLLLLAARARRAISTTTCPFEYISDPTVSSSISKLIRHYCGLYRSAERCS